MQVVAELQNDQIFNQIAEAITSYTGVDPDLINTKSRKKPLPYTRQLIAWFAISVCNVKFTNKDISERLGWKGHTGPITACEKISGFLEIKDDTVKNDLEAIIKKLNEKMPTYFKN